MTADIQSCSGMSWSLYHTHSISHVIPTITYSTLNQK